MRQSRLHDGSSLTRELTSMVAAARPRKVEMAIVLNCILDVGRHKVGSYSTKLWRVVLVLL